MTQSQVVNRQSTSSQGFDTTQFGREDVSEDIHQIGKMTAMALNAAIPPTCTPNTGAYSQHNTNALITNTPAQSTSGTNNNTNLRRNVGNSAQTTILNTNEMMTFNTSNNGLILGSGARPTENGKHHIILSGGQ